ncbi:MAG: cobalamin biosynthesis protein, partial [Gammaproteobacteria bacterium]|nr:cobalamin biosynthesis protein [Gammaproteobacteria bacterium]
MIVGLPLDLFVLLSAFVLDFFLGDPRKFPHLIVGYGKVIHFAESILNKGFGRLLKGALITSLLVIISYVVPYLVLQKIIDFGCPVLYFAVSTILLFYCLANRTLIDEGRKVFDVLEQQGLEAGRQQVSFIVGRETNK